MADNDIGGVWRTIGGRHIFIEDGDDLPTAMKKSGKFNKKLKTKIEFREQITKELTGGEQIEQIMKDMNCSEDQANNYRKAIWRFTGQGYHEINDDTITEESAKDDVFYEGVIKNRKDLDDYIKKAPRYKGEIYRGLHFSVNDPNGEEFIGKLSEGNIVNMWGVSSWSSNETVAEGFAVKKDGENGVVLRLQNKTGVGIRHLSSFENEDEVLQGRGIYYKIKKVEKVEGHTYKGQYDSHTRTSNVTYFVDVVEVKGNANRNRKKVGD